MPWLADMEVLWCLNQNNYTVDEAAGENTECHMKDVHSTQIHPWASSKSPKLSYEWSLTSEKLYNPKSEMEKASQTLRSIKFCHRGAQARGLSELCTPTKVPYFTHNPKKPCLAKKCHPQARCACLTANPNLKHNTEWLFYSGDLKFII